MLVAGRVIAGLCVGITSSIVPVYQSEIAPKEIRGRMVSLQQWAITWVSKPEIITCSNLSLTKSSGYSHPIFHPIRRFFLRRWHQQRPSTKCGFPYSMGYPDSPCSAPYRRSFLFPRISTLVSRQGQMG